MAGKLRVALVGQGISASLTPAMHEAEGRAQGLDYSYGLIDTARGDRVLGDIIRQADEDGLAGLNITHPHKIEVLAHLHELSQDAARLGAVNTVVFRGGRATGYNTDLTGFATAFAQEMSNVTLDRVLLLGAGGAGAAVAFALVARGVKTLTIHDLDREQSARLAGKLRKHYPKSRIIVVETLDQAARDGLNGLVNATPLGMDKYPGSAFPLAKLHAGMWVCDIVYFPAETALLAHARAFGCKIMPGSAMAIWQAVHAFELFTGRRADPARMRKVFIQHSQGA